jgi:hypothetical protein
VEQKHPIPVGGSGPNLPSPEPGTVKGANEEILAHGGDLCESPVCCCGLGRGQRAARRMECPTSDDAADQGGAPEDDGKGGSQEKECAAHLSFH